MKYLLQILTGGFLHMIFSHYELSGLAASYHTPCTDRLHSNGQFKPTSLYSNLTAMRVLPAADRRARI
jgi:hypothetical protein